MKCSIKKQCHKSWPDIYKTFEQPKLRQFLSVDTLQVSDDYTSNYFNKKMTIEKSDVLLPKLLDVNYEQLLNDNVESNKNSSSNGEKLHNFSNLPRRTKRRSKLFTLPLRILEESDDDTQSIISDGSRTLIPYDEFPPSKFMGVSGLGSTYFPGQDLFKFLSSGQFVQANAELDRENAHFTISEAIIGTIEQVNIWFCYFFTFICLNFVFVSILKTVKPSLSIYFVCFFLLCYYNILFKLSFKLYSIFF